MNKKTIIITFFIIVCSCSCFIRVAAQENAFTIYYDSLWNKVPKENAFFYTQFVKRDTFYQCTSYWVRSGKLRCKSFFKDTVYQKGYGNFSKAIGTLIAYYESGIVADSGQFDNTGQIAQDYTYGENGVITQHIFYDKPSEKWLGENYDANGKRKGGYFTYQEVAKFPGGASAWQDYLMSHLKARTPTRNGAPVGLYTVVVVFLVEKDGKIAEVEADNNPGYGTAEEAVRVIEKAPDWIPAQQHGKNVVYRQKQSITFQVSDR